MRLVTAAVINTPNASWVVSSLVCSLGSICSFPSLGKGCFVPKSLPNIPPSYKPNKRHCFTHPAYNQWAEFRQRLFDSSNTSVFPTKCPSSGSINVGQMFACLSEIQFDFNSVVIMGPLCLADG